MNILSIHRYILFSKMLLFFAKILENEFKFVRLLRNSRNIVHIQQK